MKSRKDIALALIKKEGFIYMYNDPLVAGKGWLDKYYLYQVPTNEIALNPELAPNNPGWE